MAYLLLAASGVLLFAYTLWRYDRKARLLALFAVAAALVMLADWIAYGWFHMYSYDTGLPLADKPDDALGEFLADLVFVPGFTVFLIRTFAPLTGVITGTIVVSVLQVLFDSLGLYIDRGWHLWQTALAFPFYFGAIYRYGYELDEVALASGWQGRLLRMCLQFDMIGLLTLLLRAGQLVHTEIHIMPTFIGNQSLGRFLTYVLVPVPLGYWVAGHRGRGRYLRLGAVLALFVVANFVMDSTGFQEFRQPYSGPLDAVAHTLVLWAGAIANDAILGMARSEDRWRPPI